MRISCLCAILASAAAGGVTCGHVTPSKELFCSGVTWNASLPLPVASLDAAAKSDFDLALDRLHRLGSTASLPLCLESWKALQCASKFQKCSAEQPAQKVCMVLPLSIPFWAAHVFLTCRSPRPPTALSFLSESFVCCGCPAQVCRTLCTQFAATCNGSEAVLARCNDELLYDEPPCTDYAELPASRRGPTRWMGASNSPDALLLLPASVGALPPTALASSPVELFQTAAGLPLLLTLGVLLMHATCCALQLSCGSSDDADAAADSGSGGATPSRDALHETIANGGRRADPRSALLTSGFKGGQAR